MKPRKLILVLSVSSILWISAPASAQESSTNAELIARLEAARQNCEWKIRTLNGGPKAMMLLHQRAMQNVLEQLKAGQAVDHDKIAKVLENHSG